MSQSWHVAQHIVDKTRTSLFNYAFKKMLRTCTMLFSLNEWILLYLQKVVNSSNLKNLKHFFFCFFFAKYTIFRTWICSFLIKIHIKPGQYRRISVINWFVHLNDIFSFLRHYNACNFFQFILYFPQNLRNARSRTPRSFILECQLLFITEKLAF